MKTIGEIWEKFNDTVISDGASDTQRREMKLAFYAGAAALAHLELLVAEPSVTEDEGTDILQAAHKEIREFYDAMLRGEE